jgi:hypothetical protein
MSVAKCSGNVFCSSLSERMDGGPFQCRLRPPLQQRSALYFARLSKCDIGSFIGAGDMAGGAAAAGEAGEFVAPLGGVHGHTCATGPALSQSAR